MRTPLRTAGVLLVAGALTLTACGTGGTTDAASASATGEPQSGGTLRVAVGSDAGCVDPQQVGSNDTIYSVRQIVDSLTDQDPETGEIVPWLAESWDVSDDATSFTFHLRDGVTFSDGTALTAAVVKANFDAVPDLGPLASLATGYLAGVSSVTAVDDLTLEVVFPTPNAQFLQATSTHSLGIVSQASTELAPQERCSQGVVGTGPFVLDEYVANQSITLSRRDGYDWGSSLWAKDGEAHLDSVVFSVVPESGTRVGSLQSDQVDVISSVGRADEVALTGAGAQLQSRANPGVVFNLGLNNSRPLLTDPVVRQAISLAINRQEVVDTVFPTGTQPATSILAHTTPGYEDLSDELGFDADEAASTLEDDGWVAGSDGIREKDGTRLSLQVHWFANSATNQPALELIQQQLKAAGIEVVLDEHPASDFVTVLSGGDFDAVWGNVTRADPDILRSSYLTSRANYYTIPASELDDVLTEQAATADPDARNELVAQAQELIAENDYVVPVVELQTQLATTSSVQDFLFDSGSRISLHDTWLS